MGPEGYLYSPNIGFMPESGIYIPSVGLLLGSYMLLAVGVNSVPSGYIKQIRI